jgi:putative membrane protein
MKLTSISLLFLGAAFFTSCGNDGGAGTGNSDTATTVDNAMANDTGASSNITNNSTTAAVSLDTIDQNFAMKAASGSMAEIEMANMAMQNGSHERVKAYAAMMIRDHGKATEELKAMAPGKGITLPTQPMPDHMKHIDMVKGKTGAAFDKTYMSHMVMAHETDINEFKKASANAKDGNIKEFASRNLPVLQMHLDSARAISKIKM